MLLGGAMLGSGAVSHVAAGGLLPHPVVVLLLAVGLTALSARFLLGRASTRRIVALVVAGQALSHAVLSALAGHRGDPAASPGPPTGHLGPAALPVTGDGHRVGSLLDAYQAGAHPTGSAGTAGLPVSWLTHLAGHVAEQGPLMVAAHLAGAVALGLWLAVGERALWALLDLAAGRLVVAMAGRRAAAAFAAVLRSAASVVPAQPHAAGFVAVPRLERPAVSRRGPPLLLAS